MNVIFHLLVAVFIGWFASDLMHDRNIIILNIIIAVVGAFLADFLLTPIFKVGTINDAKTVPTMIMTLPGSVILLAIIRLIRRL